MLANDNSMHASKGFVYIATGSVTLMIWTTKQSTAPRTARGCTNPAIMLAPRCAMKTADAAFMTYRMCRFLVDTQPASYLATCEY